MKCRTGPEIHHRLLAGRCSFVSFFTNFTYTHFCLYFFTFSSRAKEQRQERFAWSVVGGSFLSVVLQRCQSLILHANAQKCHAKDRAAFCHPSSFVFPFRLARQVVGSSFFYDSLPYPRPEKKEQKRSSFLISFALTFDIMCLCVCRCVGVWVGVLRFCVTNIDLTFFPSKPPPPFLRETLNTHTHTHKHTHTHTDTCPDLVLRCVVW